MISKKLFAPSYKWGKNPSKTVTVILKYKKSGYVLDIGAGDGRNAIFLAKEGFNVTAVEKDVASFQMLKLNAKQAKVKLKLSLQDIRQFKFDKRYDIIIAISSLHFLPRLSAVNVINRMKRHTTKGGLNIISAFIEGNGSVNFPYLFRKNEINHFYKNWAILSYREFLTPFERHGTQEAFHRHKIAALIAQKNLSFIIYNFSFWFYYEVLYRLDQDHKYCL